MININFLVDEDFIAREMISTSTMPTDFANYLWDKYRNSYIQLKNNRNANNIEKDIILELKQQDFFQSIIKDANENKDRIQQNWENNHTRINNFIEHISRQT